MVDSGGGGGGGRGRGSEGGSGGTAGDDALTVAAARDGGTTHTDLFSILCMPTLALDCGV